MVVSATQSSRSGIRCLIADGHPMMLRAIESVLMEAGFELVGALSERDDLLATIREVRPDVLVLDAAMLGISGEDLSRACAEVRVVIFTANDGDTVSREGVEPGAFAYVSKSQRLEFLVEVIDIIAAGGSWVDPAVAPTLVAKGVQVAEVLTPRERDVLALVADGRSYQEISESLSITISTVQQHVTSGVSRLGANTRTQAVAMALRLFLIQ
jgi:DNA-binding NarL/FixJ family response regulator